MQIGIIGLGRMGGNIARRLMKAGHECVVFDANAKPREKLAEEGATAVGSLERMVNALGEKPCAVWVMLPAGRITEETVERLGSLLEPDDIVIDGGNSYYKDDIRRARKLSEKRIRYVDCGTSGGGFGTRLLHDDRWSQAGRGSPRPDFRGARTGTGQYSAHAGPREKRPSAGARLHPRRPKRRGAFRKNGA
jgi:NAD binding domain of 6-phosphogluconate dehydrogenase